MTSVSDIRWGSYHDREGPSFVGRVPVPVCPPDAPFPEKILSVTTAAEGGHFDAINMWDTGLLSVGALQFIDAGQFGVCDMIGEAIEAVGLAPVEMALKPAMDMSHATLGQLPNGKWRFFINGNPVVTTAQQGVLYFGDLSGNKLGTFNDSKRLLAKTWAACVSNIWTIPGSTQAQAAYSLRRLMSDFAWGRFKQDLFSGGVSDDGWVGATRAVLLAYAVNAPAVVVAKYAQAADNPAPKLSPMWCLDVLRTVVVGGGIDVWRARWAAKRPIVKQLFGVTLPTYDDLVARRWQPPVEPPPPEPVEIVRTIPDDQGNNAAVDVIERPTRPVVADDPGWIVRLVSYALDFVKVIFGVVLRAFTKSN